MNTKLNHSLKELAQLAGVSKSTASRVISGKGYASPEVRERVLNAAEKLRYKPNAVARAMVTKRTNNIGVIVFRETLPIVSHPLYGKIIDAILMASEARGYSVFLKTDKEMSLRSTDYMLEQRVDGLILVSRLRKNVIDYVKKFNIPYLMVNGSTDDPEVIHLVSNDEEGGDARRNICMGSAIAGFSSCRAPVRTEATRCGYPVSTSDCCSWAYPGRRTFSLPNLPNPISITVSG